jgi:hypothetical protein
LSVTRSGGTNTRSFQREHVIDRGVVDVAEFDVEILQVGQIFQVGEARGW